MLAEFRHFEAGPDPFGRNWNVQFLWLQTAISIRHSDTVDAKFKLSTEGREVEKVVAIAHADLVELASRSGRPVTDPWCMKLAALHLKYMIESGEDIEKTLVTASLDDLERHNDVLRQGSRAHA